MSSQFNRTLGRTLNWDGGAPEKEPVAPPAGASIGLSHTLAQEHDVGRAHTLADERLGHTLAPDHGVGHAHTLAQEPSIALSPSLNNDRPSLGDAGRASLTDGGRPSLTGLGKTAAGRSVVLPRKTKQADGAATLEWAAHEQPRYERIGQLGEGGMGEVALEVDQDIKRKVAVKRLRMETKTPAALLRFAEEVRVVGSLEHPGIIPVHDVGIDEQGQHYAVMKYLEGETLETVIEKLKAKDPSYERKYSMEYRARLFAKVLEAVRFAHSKGVIHRDIKPANIMVGPFGEVTVLDWGIAKHIRTKEGAGDALKITLREEGIGAAAAASEAPKKDPTSKHDARLVQTHTGALLGTPMYMSPEQAAGKNDELDERSDIFSLCVVFYELLSLKHPLEDKKSINEVLVHLTTHEWDHLKLRLPALSAGVPCELLRVLQEGFYLDPAKRYQSIVEFERRLDDVLAGKVPPDCYITKSKRGAHAFMHFVDRHPYAYAPMYYGFFVLVFGSIAALIWSFVRR